MNGRPADALRVVRVVRGALLAVSSTVLTLTAHVAGGGAPPDAGLTVLLTLLIAAAGIALADRRRSGPAILGALVAAQTLMHLILVVLCRHDEFPFAFDGTMLLAHVAAVLITGLLLTRAESAIFAAMAALSMLLPRPNPPLPARTAPLPVINSTLVGHVLDVLLRRICARRGPPVRH